MDISDTLISFETAKLAKEKGFIIPTLCYFRYDEKQCKGSLLDWNEDVGFYSRPTQSLLQKWLREVHKINVYCMSCEHDESLWYNNIASHNPVFIGTYEEALEIGLQEGLNLLP